MRNDPGFWLILTGLVLGFVVVPMIGCCAETNRRHYELKKLEVETKCRPCPCERCK